MTSKTKSILIIKLDAIGDYVLFRNFLSEIKNDGYSITFLGNIKIKHLAEGLDRMIVDKFIWFDVEKRKNIFYLFKIYFKLIKNFSIIIQASFSRSSISDFLVKISKSKLKIGFNGDNNNISEKYKKITDKWYDKLVDIDKKNVFEFYKNREFFSVILNREIQIKKPFIDKTIINLNKISLPDNFVVLFSGASADKRKWSKDNFIKISECLINNYKFNIVVCGSGEDKISFENEKFFDMTGKTNLMQLVYIISKSKLIIFNDTSGAHIGAALDIPTIVLSQFNHYGRFFPYPPEISEKNICLTPDIFNNLSKEELIDKFKFNSDIDISSLSIDKVKKTIDLILKK
jgi:ADP-heptose:LPS heptosyltransferase